MKLRFLKVASASLLALSSSSAFSIVPSALRASFGHHSPSASVSSSFSATCSYVQHGVRSEQRPFLAGHDTSMSAAWLGGPWSGDCAPAAALKILPGGNSGKARDASAASAAAAAVSSTQRRATTKKVLQSVGVSLAWYLGSSAVALAVASVSGLPLEARPRRSLRIGPTLLILYIFSAKNVKKRGRFEGVIPKDEDSRKLLADDARDLAMSWGRPAGRIAYTLVDMFVFLFVFRYSGLDFKKLLLGQGMAQLLSPDFWIPIGAIMAVVSLALTKFIRGFGYGYLRSTAASMLAPMMQAVVVKPAKAVASVAGAGSEWDTGLTPTERKARRSSRELRESLSTFKDVDFVNDGDVSTSQPPPPPSSSAGDGLGQEKDGDGDDASPPDLKRTS